MIENEMDESVNAAKEESSDESTVISSQTSTLTRNQGRKYFWVISNIFFILIIYKIYLLIGHDEMQQAVLAMNLQEQLSLCSDEEDSDDEDQCNQGEACGGKLEDVYDDGKRF